MSHLIVAAAPFHGDELTVHLVGQHLEVESRPLRDGSGKFVTLVRDTGTETVVGSYFSDTVPQALRLHADALEGAVRYVEAGGSAANVRGMVAFFHSFETMTDPAVSPVRF